MAEPSALFKQCFAIIVGSEGGFDADPRDTGNWTGGALAQGVLKGTKYGISAAAYPLLDIKNLTLAQAWDIYQMQYWIKICADALPPVLALATFDAAVNSGVGRAAAWLQAAVGAKADGVIGSGTIAAVNQATSAPESLDEVAASLLAARLIFMSTLAAWPVYRGGWVKRVCSLPFKAARFVL